MKIFNNHKKAVIFDLDGTLLDSSEVYYVATEQTFTNKDKEYGFVLGKAIERYGATKGAEIIGISKEDMFQWLNTWIDIQEDYTRIFPSTLTLLQNLSDEGFMFGINTNRPQSTEEVKRTLKRHVLDHLFPVIQTAKTTNVRKPDPKGILDILSRLHISKDQSYFVGDSYVDVLAGKNAGVTTIAVTTGVYSKQELEEYSPHYIIDDIASVENIVCIGQHCNKKKI